LFPYLCFEYMHVFQILHDWGSTSPWGSVSFQVHVCSYVSSPHWWISFIFLGLIIELLMAWLVDVSITQNMPTSCFNHLKHGHCTWLNEIESWSRNLNIIHWCLSMINMFIFNVLYIMFLVI
jgi:hypothetical protein